MPIIKSAKKKVRKDKKRTEINKKIKVNLRAAIKKMERSPSLEALKKASSALDRAAKKKYIHKKKAARDKKRLAKLLNKSALKKTKPATKKKTKTLSKKNKKK